jgi:hypothetical protein
VIGASDLLLFANVLAASLAIVTLTSYLFMYHSSREVGAPPSKSPQVPLKNEAETAAEFLMPEVGGLYWIQKGSST